MSIIAIILFLNMLCDGCWKIIHMKDALFAVRVKFIFYKLMIIIISLQE